jgi:DNA-binding NarL/FixJ family response regulator
MKANSPDEHPQPTPIRVMLADDHELVRAGFRMLLVDLGMQVVAEACDGKEALHLIAMHQPDVVLMDIAMPEMNGLETTEQVAQKYPNSRVILLSMHANAEYARRALRAGAAGYLLKNSTMRELEMAISAVVRGETYLTPAVAHFVAEDYVRTGKSKPGTQDGLTPRQCQVLQLIAQGYTRKQIAAKLKISPRTFDTLRLQLMQKLNIHDTAGLMRYATRMGVQSSEE